MESSKKTSDYFREFQDVRSRSDVEKVRDRIWRRRRILYIRNSMGEEEEKEEEDKSFLKVVFFEICADGIYPPAPPDR